jgi:dihydroorotase
LDSGQWAVRKNARADRGRALLVRGGRVIDPANGVDAGLDVLVREGVIARVERGIAAPDARVVEASGCVVCPGLVDMHVHLRQPGQEHKETVASGTQAALAGGFATVACMPNTDPPLDNPKTLASLRGVIERDARCRVHIVGAATVGLRGEEPTDLAALQAAGCVAVSDDGFPIQSSEVLLAVLERAMRQDMLFIPHCEDKTFSGDGVMHEGEVSRELGLPGISFMAEYAAVEQVVALLCQAPTRTHISHLSLADSLQCVREAKAMGLPVTAEVCPHHFALTDEAVRQYGSNAKMNPPLRTQRDVDTLLEGLADGAIDVIATDHAPHTQQEKATGMLNAPFGVIGLETALPVVVTRLVHAGILSLSDAIAKVTINPARILRLDAGTLSEGAPADVTILDPDADVIVEPDRFRSKGRNTPFAGWRLKGAVRQVIVGGETVDDE